MAADPQKIDLGRWCKPGRWNRIEQFFAAGDARVVWISGKAIATIRQERDG